jgi:microcystin-dependent protein
MVVLVDGSFIGSSKIRVYVKTQGTSGTQGVFDDNPWQELYPEGDPLPGRFQELKPLGDVGGMMRFSTDKLNPGLGDFSSYQIKILLMGPSANNDGNSMEIPKLSSVAAVPLRRISQDEIRRYVPVGSIMAYAGDAIPYGFAECNGDMYDFGADPEYKVLFDVIGTQYNIGGETTNQYRVPDLRSRVPVGLGSVGQVELDAARTARSMGATGGVEKMPQHEHRMFPLSSTSTILSGGGGTDFEYFGAQPFRDFSLGRIGDEDSSSGGGGPQLWGPNNTGVNPAAGYVRTQTKGYLGAEGVPAGSVKFEETTEAASYKEEANMTPYQVTKYIIQI